MEDVSRPAPPTSPLAASSPPCDPVRPFSFLNESLSRVLALLFLASSQVLLDGHPVSTLVQSPSSVRMPLGSLGPLLSSH